MNVHKGNGLKLFAAAAGLFLLLSWVQFKPATKGGQVLAGGGGGSGEQSELVPGEGSGEITGEEIVSDPTAADGTGAATDTGTGAVGTGRTATPGAAKAAAGTECARGKNGGATDTGVTASQIRLASTAVLDGPAKSLLEDSTLAMKAVVDKVNKAGGICGRLLRLTIVNDSFRGDSGLQYIRNFIEEGYFALPVVPSAEGLGSAIENGVISKAKIPVIGTDGMRQEQYGDPYVWPVASATVTAMRVMAKFGYEKRGAKTFALVWDQKYQFGREGKDAFIKQVEAVAGKGAMVVDIPLNPDNPSYGTQQQTFNGACGNSKCDMVAMLLLPETAKKWLQSQPERAAIYTAGAQTLFTNGFAEDCVRLIGNACQGFAVWTGYNPPIGPLASLPGVAQYVNDVRAVKSNIDINNQFIEGAYLGMSVFVEALRKVGPNLTRERLRQVMDSMSYASDVTSTLTWKPNQHAANVRSQSFSVTTSAGSFRGWSNEGTGFVLDPAHGG